MASSTTLHAQEPLVPIPLPAPPPESPPSIAALRGLVMLTLYEVVPDQYVDESKWNLTKYHTIGLRVEGKGLKARVRRRKKEVKHGLWKRYQIDLPDSDQWDISLSEMRDLGDGRVGFSASFRTPLQVLARASHWERDLQLYSISAQADATVKLSVDCEMSMKVNATRFPPDIQLVPAVTDARLQVEHFRLNRVSQLRGPLVRELGEEAHDILQREINKRREKLTSKLNKQIEKNQSKLTLSLADLGRSQWKVLTEYLPQEDE